MYKVVAIDIKSGKKYLVVDPLGIELSSHDEELDALDKVAELEEKEVLRRHKKRMLDDLLQKDD